MRGWLFALASWVPFACVVPPSGGPPARDAGVDAGQVADAGVGSGDAGLPGTVGTWTWIPIAGSMCASGSAAGFGVNPSGAGDDLLIYLEGGGACWNQGSCIPSLLQFGPLCGYGTVCILTGPGANQP